MGPSCGEQLQSEIYLEDEILIAASQNLDRVHMLMRGTLMVNLNATCEAAGLTQDPQLPTPCPVPSAH